MQKKILVIGGGGHAKVVIDALLANSYEIAGVLEASEDRIGTLVCGVPIIGCDADASRLYNEGVREAVVAIGHLGNGAIRQRCITQLREIGFHLPAIIHPRAVISPFAHIGDGTVVFAGAVVNPDARVGENCIINTGAVVEHDVVLGENVHVAPRAAISGAARVGSGTFVGMGSCILQGRTVGMNCIVGAGSVVLRDVPDGMTVVGVPAVCKKGGV